MRHRTPWIALVLFLLPLAACDDDDCQTCPPPDEPPVPTLENVWPNEDGRQWTYDFTYRVVLDPITAFADSFTIDDADSLLARPFPANATVEYDDLWRLRFDGTTTTDSGESGQFLRGFLYLDSAGVRREIPSPFGSRTSKLLERTRPTSIDRLARRVSSVGGLMLDGDVAFTKDAERIGAYADISTGLLWKYLEADLSVGHEFRFPLLAGTEPGLAIVVRVRDVRDLETAHGTYPNTVSVIYLIDYGTMVITDEGGGPVDVGRAYTIGRIEYAPGVGPVYNRELFFGASENGLAGSEGAAEAEYRLIGTGVVTN